MCLCLGGRAGLELAPPAHENAVHARGAEDGAGWHREMPGCRMNGRVCWPPMPPWKQISSSNAQPSSSSGS